MSKHLALSVSLTLAAALLLLAPGAGHAQGAKPQSPKATPEKPESSTPPATTPRRSRRNVDARECLKYPTNMEIHRCALKYL